MKVGFIAPQSIAAVNGGVRTQALMTAKHLKILDVDVEFISPWTDLSNSKIDIYHVFVATPETIGIVSRLHEQHKKIALSPVLFSNRSASNIKKLLTVEQAFTKISQGIRSEFAIKKEICSKADIILPNTSDEALLIENGFDISSQKIHQIPNGVEERFTESDPTLFEHSKGLKDFVLFAGQASAPRKNVHKLLQAFQNIDADLVIIGDISNSEYSSKCQTLATQNERVHLFPTLPHNSDLLASAYSACKVFVLPSQYETPGISAMEAALAGANVVITEVGGTKDYFEGFAEFVSPNSTLSIKNGIKRALEKPKSDQLKNHILSNFTWNKVAEQTLVQYKKGVTLKKKVLVAFGTRPEIIKLAPVIQELEKSVLEVISVHTGQHDELAQDMLDLFKVVPDYDLKSMASTSDLFELTEFLLPKLKELFLTEKPDVVMVQGDTTSSFLCALAAFYLEIPVYHVEAGLRSFDNYNPFPEELNRKQISALASIHFAPTSIAKENLIAENIDSANIFETGNTVIDALYQIKKSKEYSTSRPSVLEQITEDQTLILVTSHRRENLGDPLKSILKALIQVLDQDPSRVMLYPAHPNPSVQEIVNSKEFSHERLKIIEPLRYLEFHHLLERTDLILTDSGGIQEEAAALGKKMLVLRETTERQELLENGFTKLVGSDEKKIVLETESILRSTIKKSISNPYGDGNASKKIVDIILKKIN